MQKKIKIGEDIFESLEKRKKVDKQCRQHKFNKDHRISKRKRGTTP
jgi:hypothetical protein